MKTLTAIVRTDRLQKIVDAFVDKGIRGMTITEVKGIGEQMQLLSPYTIHSRIELIVPNDIVIDIANIILEHAHTGETGDGLIAVYPMDAMLKIRTKERVE